MPRANSHAAFLSPGEQAHLCPLKWSPAKCFLGLDSVGCRLLGISLLTGCNNSWCVLPI